VLLNRRVLSLSITTPKDIASEPLTLPPRASTDDLLVTSLTIWRSIDDPAGYVAAAPIGALLTSLPSLTSLTLNLPRTPVGSELFKMLCAALQSPRAPALETLRLWNPVLQNGAAADFATALRLRQNPTLSELHLHTYLGGDADCAKIVRALMSAPFTLCTRTLWIARPVAPCRARLSPSC
jgi:hypothetical protein